MEAMNPVPVSLPFDDRSEAGRRLAERVRPYAAADPLVLALPCGGVPVGAELARRLGSGFDVLVVRRIGLPGRPEAGVGVITEDGQVAFDDRALARLGVPRRALEGAVESERAELRRRCRRYRGGRPAPRLAGRDVIVVDEGAVTGATARAALRMVRRQHPARLVMAVPVASQHAASELSGEADVLVVLTAPESFHSVGQWYRDFPALTDGHVTALLAESEDGADEAAGAERGVRIRVGEDHLDGDLTMPAVFRGAIVVAVGRGRGDPRWRAITSAFHRAGYATLLLDVMTAAEQDRPEPGADTGVLGERLGAAVGWLRRATEAANAPVGLLGSGFAAPAALVTAAARPEDVGAVVAHGGRIDLAGRSLSRVRVPVLVLLEGADSFVRELGEWALGRIGTRYDLRVMAGAEQLLQGAQEWREMSAEALEWFDRNLVR